VRLREAGSHEELVGKSVRGLLATAWLLSLASSVSAAPGLVAGLRVAGGAPQGGKGLVPKGGLAVHLRGGDGSGAGDSEGLFKQPVREANVQMAKFAEQAERFEEMMEATRTVAEMGVELTVEERSLLSVAYKNVVGAKRSSWKTLSALDARQTEPPAKELTQKYLRKVEGELSSVCEEIIALLDRYLIPKAAEAEPKVFYLKMHGDYWRYLAEVSGSDAKAAAAERALAAYKAAQELAVEHLSTTHPIRLGLALNFSVFYYEILGLPGDACALARQAFDDSCKDLDNLNEESYKDATLIMQLLRDNLTLWTADSSLAYGNSHPGNA